MASKDSKKRKPAKKKFQKVASDRISELFSVAEEDFFRSPERSARVLAIAKKMSLKHKVPFSKTQKMLFCKKCGAYLFPGRSSRVRVSRGKVVVLCLACKDLRRYVYK